MNDLFSTVWNFLVCSKWPSRVSAGCECLCLYHPGCARWRRRAGPWRAYTCTGRCRRLPPRRSAAKRWARGSHALTSARRCRPGGRCSQSSARKKLTDYTGWCQGKRREKDCPSSSSSSSPRHPWDKIRYRQILWWNIHFIEAILGGPEDILGDLKTTQKRPRHHNFAFI